MRSVSGDGEIIICKEEDVMNEELAFNNQEEEKCSAEDKKGKKIGGSFLRLFI